MIREISKKETNIIKAIGILLVVIGHTSIQMTGRFEFLSIMNEMGAYGVAIFLIISGYGLTKSAQEHGINAKTFWKKRVKTVFIPYIIVTLTWIFLGALYGIKYPVNGIFLAILGFDFTRAIDGTMWYISFIVCWYIVFFIAFCGKKKSVSRILIFFAYILICLWLYRYGLIINLTYQWSLHVFSFPLGVILAKNNKIIRIISNNWITGLIGVTAITGFYYLYKVSRLFILYKIVCVFFAIFIVMVICKAFVYLPDKISKLLNLIGKHSFEIYLIEGYLFNVYSSFSNLYIAFITYIILLIGGVFVLHNCLEKLKLIK